MHCDYSLCVILVDVFVEYRSDHVLFCLVCPFLSFLKEKCIPLITIMLLKTKTKQFLSQHDR